MDIYWKENGEGESYKSVVLELMNGNSFLMFPTKNDFKTDPNNWTTTASETALKIASIFNINGFKILGAFTDEQALVHWTKHTSEYTVLRSQDILKFCQENGIDKIIINSNRPNMFVLERDRENVKEHK